MDRVILHVDLDAFYASIEEREDPSLRGKPVVVCMFSARGGDSGAVATPNYEARKAGIRSGMSIKQAKKREPDAVYLPARREFYFSVSDNVMKILRSYADAFEQVSIDEAFLDISRTTNGDFDKSVKIAKRVKRKIKRKERLTCSIGVGPNKLIAKMASSVKKPDGLTVVRPADVEGFLGSLDVIKLWGVGGKSKKALKDIGVETIGELAKVELSKLVGIFGKAKGQWLYNASRGIDEEPVQERGEREQIGRITTLEEDTRNFETIAGRINDLAEEVHERVVEREAMFRTITFVAVTDDLKGHTKSRTLAAPTDELKAIQDTGEELIRTFLSENELLIRRAGIQVSNFTKPTGQKTLLQF
ncbi:MAG: DNA polymerase IV [Candidatus Hydrothermarchaeales archaeon]